MSNALTHSRLVILLAAVAMVMLALVLYQSPSLADNHPRGWDREWPDTDFSRRSIEFSEILSGGPPKDGIPAIDDPKFVHIDEVESLQDQEAVIGVVINGEAKAYPLQVLMWHEIVNDTLGGKPITVTYCPLCNSSIVFDRNLDGRLLDFGTTGKLRNSDLVMYDRQTQSWFQQFTGVGIVGELTGRELSVLPSRLESFANFKVRAPEGKVLVPNNVGLRSYGRNPYVGYDNRSGPYGFFTGEMPEGIEPMVRVVAIGKEAWSLPLLRKNGVLVKGDMEIRWQAGQASALDAGTIANGRDVGNVVVRRKTGGAWQDIPYDVTFAFVFHAFNPEGTIHK